MKENFAIGFAKVVGTPDNLCWSQTHSYFPEDIQKKEKRGHLMAVLTIHGSSEGVEAVSAGREVLSRLHEEYFGNLDGSIFQRLGEAVEKVCQERGQVEITAAVLSGNALYLAVFGQGKVWLKRQDKFGLVLSGGGELKSSSGFVKDGDILLLGSEKFWSVVGEGTIRVSLANGDIHEAVEVLAPVVLGHEKTAEVAAVLSLFKKETIEELSKIEEEEEVIPAAEDSSPKRKNIFSFLPQKRIFVCRRDGSGKKKIYFILGLFLLVLLLGLAGFGIQKKIASKRQSRQEELLAKVREKFDQGKALLSSETAEARKIAQEAKTELQLILEKEKNLKNGELLKQEIEDFLAASVQEISTEPTLFMDLNLIADGASGKTFFLQDGSLSILDSLRQKVYSLNIEKKSSDIYSFSAENAEFITGFGNKVFVFSAKGVEEIDLKTKTASLKISQDSNWKTLVGLGTFGGNLYLLDKGAGTIWRYLNADGSFGAGKNWLADSVPDMTKAVSVAIDGSIWILTEGGVLKFAFGKQESFSLSKMPESFENSVKIYTSEKEENLYVMDKGRGKIYQIAKTGEFKIAYSWEGIKQADDLVAIESSKKIFLLSGSKVYEIGMR